jgi:holo-[acyl-carrier-protein] synthase
MIAGIGVDIMQVERIHDAVDRHGERFLRRIYTPEEIDYCRNGAHPFQRFATRFAAKEAVLKALGVGWQRGTSFRDVVVKIDDLGAPSVELSGRSKEIAREKDVHSIHLSLSHDRQYAVAQAVAEKQ